MARTTARHSNNGAAETTQPGPDNAVPSTLLNSAALDTQAVDDAQREALLQQKQLELAQVLDRHDDYLRELFQLERFGNMLFYDPKAAKQDHSAVFEEWKMKYDLVMNAPTAGPSRTTRRAQQERFSVLKTDPQKKASTTKDTASIVRTNGPGAVQSQSPRSVSVGSGRNKTEKRLSAIAKGKQREGVFDDQSPAVEQSESISGTWRTKGKGKARLKDSGVTRRHNPIASEEIPSPAESCSIAESHSRRRSYKFKEPEIPSKIIARNPPSASQGKDPRLKRRGSIPSLSRSPSASNFRITIPSSPAKKTVSNEVRPTVSGKTLPGMKHPADTEPIASRPVIKRIRLIVREPPPTISSPQQRPPRPQFGRNLTSLLQSFRYVDNDEHDERNFERTAVRKARLLRRIENMKKEGRLLLDPDTALALSGRDEHGARSIAVPCSSFPDPRPTDPWSHIVNEAISVRNTLSRHRFGRGGAVASSVESRVRSYFNSQKTLEQREAAAEEKRLRLLAKSTLRHVLGEWKRVVAHIREEERLRKEKEANRLGRQHLDAILDQSGQILEKQQMELNRTDVLRDMSRSVSASVIDEDEEDDEQETEAEGDEVDDEGTEPTDDLPSLDNLARVDGDRVVDDKGDVSSDEEGEVGLSALFRDVLKSSRPTSEGTPLESAGTNTVDPSEVDSQAGTSLAEDMSISDDEVEQEDQEVYADDILPGAIGLGTEVDDDHSATGAPPPVLVEGSELMHTNGLYQLGLMMAQAATLGQKLDAREVKTIATSVHDTQVSLATPPAQGPSPSETVVADSHADTEKHNHVHGDGKPCYQPNGLNKGHVKDLLEDILHDAKIDDQTMVSPDPAAKSTETLGEPASELAGENARWNGDTDSHSRAREQTPEGADSDQKEVEESAEPEWEPPEELQQYAVARVDWYPEDKLTPPLLLRGTLRPYQQSGLEWLATLHNNKMNGILADEMGLGKTIQTIALLAHLACDRGIWGPHLIIVPTSVLLNWEMEFKKFLPGFKILSYHGTTKRRKELRKGWNDKYSFNVCVTSYTLASRDEHILKRKPWYYMILDEAHMIKNFRSQRWNILLMFRSFRRLLLTGTPLQNNLTELWALLQFLMSGTKFANLKEFGEWFSNPLEKAIEQGNVLDLEVQQRVMKLHTVLRPYLLRRLKRDVEKELPSKYEHLVLCRLSKRQRFLYDEFMSRSQTREDLKSGVYQKIANILMQLRKVCNHPDLFEVRPIVTSFAIERSAIADFEIKELLIRRMIIEDEDKTSHLNLDLLGLQFVHQQDSSIMAANSCRRLEQLLFSELRDALPGEPPPEDLRTVEGYRRYRAYQHRLADYLRWLHVSYINAFRCRRTPIYGTEIINVVKKLYNPLTAQCAVELRSSQSPFNTLIKGYSTRAEECADIIDKFAFATPAVVVRDLPSIALRELPEDVLRPLDTSYDSPLHRSAVRLQIAFPDVSLLQYDCGKLQELARLLHERKAGGHRVLIFTQMTRILDILEIFLNYHGYLYLRLDGATKIEDRQYITERFNVDARVFAFIASSRSGGVGINLTGADTVIFYDSDFNPQMDRQCEDRAHRIGQIRDVHIYRFVSQYTVEEAMLRKANQKRSLDDLVIQKGEFDWRNFFNADDDEPAAKEIQKALVEFEDFEDAYAAKVAANEEAAIEGEDRADFGDADGPVEQSLAQNGASQTVPEIASDGIPDEVPNEDDDEGGAVVDYMLSFVRYDPDHFREWKL